MPFFIFMTEKDFEIAFREYFTMLRNMAYPVVYDDDTAKDMVQQVFLNLWNKKDSLVIKGSVKSYLQRAVINASINHIKKQKKLNLTEQFDNFDIIDDERYDDNRQKQIENGVKQAIDQLSPKVRLMFSLSRYSNMQNKEIAEHLGVSVKAVEKNIGKALKELRVALKPLYSTMLILFFVIMVGFLKYILS